jgi:hypothetical protein
MLESGELTWCGVAFFCWGGDLSRGRDMMEVVEGSWDS